MLQSLIKNRIGILWMLCSSLCVCTGQLLWKLAVEGNIELLSIGFVLYGIGALLMLIAYKFGSLSVLQPMLSMNYIVALLLANFVLKETISLLKIVGILVLTVSVILIGGGED